MRMIDLSIDETYDTRGNKDIKIIIKSLYQMFLFNSFVMSFVTCQRIF